MSWDAANHRSNYAADSVCRSDIEEQGLGPKYGITLGQFLIPQEGDGQKMKARDMNRDACGRKLGTDQTLLAIHTDRLLQDGRKI